MNTFRSRSSDPAPRRIATTGDEAAAWQELFDALREYSAAIATLEQMTVDWLADQAPPVAGSAEDSADFTKPRLELAEAACARARVRCAEALTRLDALSIAVDRSGRIIPFPIDRRPSVNRPAPIRSPSRPARRDRRPGSA